MTSSSKLTNSLTSSNELYNGAGATRIALGSLTSTMTPIPDRDFSTECIGTLNSKDSCAPLLSTSQGVMIVINDPSLDLSSNSRYAIIYVF